MFNKYDGKVGAREYACIVWLVIGIKFTDATPTLIFKEAKNAGWFIPFISALPAVISLFALLILLKRYNKGLMDIVFQLMGKYFGFVIGMLFFLPNLLLTSMNFRSYVDILNAISYPKTPVAAMCAALIVPCCFLSIRGFEAIGRTIYLLMYYIQIVLLLLVILALKDINFGYIFPVTGSGIKALIMGGFNQSTMYDELIQFAVLFSFVRSYKDFKIGSFIGLAMGGIEVVLFLLLYVIVFDYPPITLINYIFQALTRQIYLGRFITNFEGIFLFFWTCAALVRFSIYMYLAAAYFAYALRLPEFKAFIIPMAALIGIISLIPENYTVGIGNLRAVFLTNNWIINYSIPLILLCISQLKGDYKNEKKIQTC